VHAHRLVHLIKDSSAKAGISLCPGTPVSVLEDLIEDLDLVLIMTVNPGFGGQKFIPHSLEKLKALKELCRKHNVHPLIEVDGGISAANAADVVAAGADMLVAGSAVFGQEDRGATIEAIRNAGESALTAQG
ncbi:MAG: ribulose-phosphate 3-epimerase, partial [Atopobium sp.]|nr:ribulose-phosphate 3-epimerase [Atopobium sp.]